MADHDLTDPRLFMNGPWRLLVLDRDPQDPKWIVATVSIAADVRPAVLDAAGRYTGWPQTAQWVAELVGRPVALMPLHNSLAWRVDEMGR
jgi:hypothetical protein